MRPDQDPAIDDAHLQSADALAARLEVNPRIGLTAEQAQRRRDIHGENRLPEAAPRGVIRRIVDQFRDFMVLVLISAALLSGVIGDLADTVAIAAIVLLNAAIGLTQEWRAERALDALKRLAAARTTVRRDGLALTIDTSHLVPGDVVLLEAGNLVPADLRLHKVAQLRVDESTLTGESVTVEKSTAHLREGEHPLGDRLNMAFKGTVVTHGRAEGLVVATGQRTELGRIAGLLRDTGARSTPLQLRLADFGRRLSLVVLFICGLVFTIGVVRGEPVLLMALTAVSLAVAAIPEALPAVVTVLLALGARRMVKVNALVRRLPSVETLGSVSVICSDKTGTLTQNRMQVQAVEYPGGGTPQPLWTAALLCNDASPDANGAWVGDPTETALVDAAMRSGMDPQAIRAAHVRLHEWPFDSERKRMSTLHRDGSDWVVFTKGAPEALVPRCTRVARGQQEAALDVAQALGAAAAMAEQGLRVLAVARRSFGTDPAGQPAEAVEADLVLLGLVGLADPPRPEVKAAVSDCRSAGITPVMITGDHPATALAIARELGIADANSPVLTGVQLAELDEPALRRLAGDVHVYARVDPAQKIRIVQALQAQGQFVAMTGDGVNDAPALKQADIGVAMGLGGTDVAREAASLVLLDDNFASIVAAVREGRRIFDNIRKFIRYAITGNSAEIWTLLLAPLMGMPIPLLPLHILWINLVTDGLPGLAFAAEPAERGVMRRPPRPPGESLFAGGIWQHTLWVGLLIAALCLGVQAWALKTGMHWQTMVFTVLTLSQMGYVLAIRSESESLFTQGLRSNLPMAGAVLSTFALQLAVIYVPPLQKVFRTEALAVGELAICLASAVVVFAIVETEKWLRRSARRLRPAEAGTHQEPAA
ncbi:MULTISPECIES: cation-translocating P-type ATPase [unclassified Variovorax]|uniref:cation-translocating P-type ATPase n=1 Tax=unclassified Variovorax TaxID=663243 RepID=UPI00076D9F5D|nr:MULTISPECIES: cation-translocating P-type ATPase [unclassified Variovorax]KWT94087.1 Cation-transporting ATPase [Variovorax sp. WDL1]PNG59953.1 Calcium-transporting ATPase 1 [Variovorax sp. B4]PNG60255.1 Calcium-transporting ATPase 1 [Variovorax sp. B2]VTV13908.1 Calcium-transporting ATPase [Variovorax sp. WDL1]